MEMPEPSAGRPRSSADRAAVLAVTGLAGAALLGAAFAGDGSGDEGVLPVGGLSVALLAIALLAFSFGAIPLPRMGASGVALLASVLLLVAWTAATIGWSIVPDRSWEAFNKSAAFAAFLGLGVVLAGVTGRAAARAGASVLAAVIGFVLVWALVSKAVPALDPEGDRVARLREPVGYWNALALLADLAIPLALWLGASRGRPLWARVLGGLLAYVATLALLLTLSRAGLVVAAGVVVLWLLLSRERGEGGLLLAASAVPAGLVAAWAFTRPALVEDGAERADRVADGAVFGVLALVGAALVVVLAVLGARRELDESLRPRAARALLVAGGLVLAAGVAAAAVAIGNPVTWLDEEVTGSSCSEVVNDPSRLGSLNLNNRWCWWNQAVDVYVDHAPLGAGAGTYEIARKRYRTDVRNVVQPHSLPLQQLADGGIPALLLFLALVVSGAAVSVGALRRLEGGERAAAAALVAAPAAYLGHALVDYSWDFLAATAPVMLVLGVLAGAGQVPLEVRRRPLLAFGSVLVALVLVASFALPRVAERSVRASTRALGEDDFARARDRAQWARVLNPLSVDPVFALARVAERQRFQNTAEKRYIQAVELQPENPAAWYALGLYEFQVLRNMCAAYRFLNDAYTLDPAGSQWTKGGPLDVAREAVNAGACAPGS